MTLKGLYINPLNECMNYIPNRLLETSVLHKIRSIERGSASFKNDVLRAKPAKTMDRN